MGPPLALVFLEREKDGIEDNNEAEEEEEEGGFDGDERAEHVEKARPDTADE